MKNLFLTAIIGFLATASTSGATQLAVFSHTCSRQEAATSGIKEIDCEGFDFVRVDATKKVTTLKTLFSDGKRADEERRWSLNAIMSGLNSKHEGEIQTAIAASSSMAEVLEKLSPLVEQACSEGKSEMTYSRYTSVLIPELGCIR
jgi:hypothetical protein